MGIRIYGIRLYNLKVNKYHKLPNNNPNNKHLFWMKMTLFSRILILIILTLKKMILSSNGGLLNQFNRLRLLARGITIGVFQIIIKNKLLYSK